MTELSDAKISVVVPTLDAGERLEALLEALRLQSRPPAEVVAVDSSSTDGTRQRLEAAGARLAVIARQEFRHGRSRNLGAGLASGDILVFMTQDALPAHPDLLRELVRPITEEGVAASFARQLAGPEATPLERYARLTNYPAVSRRVAPADAGRLGVRAVFFSNSCSAICKSVFEALGGFPENTIMNEDMLFAARLLKAGHTIAYQSTAAVTHSHRYSPLQTFRRYFDIGVVFRQAAEELATYRLTRAGGRYTAGLATFLRREGQLRWLPAALLETLAKGAGYFLGRHYERLPVSLVKTFSLHRGYWDPKPGERAG